MQERGPQSLSGNAKTTIELSDGSTTWLYRDDIVDIAVVGKRNFHGVVKLRDGKSYHLSEEQNVGTLIDFWREGWF